MKKERDIVIAEKAFSSLPRFDITWEDTYDGPAIYIQTGHGRRRVGLTRAFWDELFTRNSPYCRGIEAFWSDQNNWQEHMTDLRHAPVYGVNHIYDPDVPVMPLGTCSVLMKRKGIGSGVTIVNNEIAIISPFVIGTHADTGKPLWDYRCYFSSQRDASPMDGVVLVSNRPESRRLNIDGEVSKRLLKYFYQRIEQSRSVGECITFQDDC